MKINHEQDGDILLPKLKQKTNRKTRNTKLEDEQIDEKYFRIDKTYNFRNIDQDYIEEKNNNIIEENKNYNNINSLVIEILEKINCPFEEVFSYSLNMCKKLNVNDNDIKELTEMLFQINKTITSKELYLNSQTLINIGKILQYSYSNFHKYKIKSFEKFEEAINKFRKSEENIFTDFMLWCVSNQEPENIAFSLYRKKDKKKYIIPSELVMLLNVYQNITTIILEINKLDYQDIGEDDYTFFELSILNLYWVLNSLTNIKFNFISKELELSFRGRNRETYEINCSYLNTSTKPVNITFNDVKYFNQKWDFSYKLNMHEKNSMNNEKIIPWMEIYKQNNVNRINIIGKRKKLFEFIFISFFSLNFYNKENINFELIIDNCYTCEFYILFEEIFKSNLLNNNHLFFHITDLLLYNNIINCINKLNIEINFLDNNAVKKFTSFLYHNDRITDLNISFFSTDIAYMSESLLMLYFGLFSNIEEFRNELNRDYDRDTYLFCEVKEIDDKIIDNLFLKFADSLAIFFECIKTKKNLKELGFNFEVPFNIRKKTKYMNTIFKFILNVLYFVSKQKIKKFCLISPYTEINSVTSPNINNLISNINFNKNEHYEELTLQMQFYLSPCITSFVNSRIRILNIGNLDLFTFKVLCDYICKYSFSKNSCLQHITIGLLGSISEFTDEVKELFGELFRIKINSLISLSLLTEIHLNDKNEYLEILDLINYNWISKYIIKFDDSSKDIYIKESKSLLNLECLSSYFLDIESKKNDDNIFENIEDLDDETYWYLKYLFNHKYKLESKSDEIIKKLIFNILKYTHTINKPNISHIY